MYDVMSKDDIKWFEEGHRTIATSGDMVVKSSSSASSEISSSFGGIAVNPDWMECWKVVNTVRKRS